MKASKNFTHEIFRWPAWQEAQLGLKVRTPSDYTWRQTRPHLADNIFSQWVTNSTRRYNLSPQMSPPTPHSSPQPPPSPPTHPLPKQRSNGATLSGKKSLKLMDRERHRGTPVTEYLYMYFNSCVQAFVITYLAWINLQTSLLIWAC